MRSIFLASALMAAIVVGVQATAYAGSSPDNTNSRRKNAPATTAPTKLLQTFFRSGSGGITLAANAFTPISTVSVTCNNAAGCSIGVESMIQIQPPAGTQWAICPQVGGVFMSPPCPFQGLLPAVSSFVTGNGRSNITVPLGTHTVTTTVFVSAASTLRNWESDVRLYKP
ncbi:MAG: hypothetical protein WCD18_23555 [Thermosynechococcaceae cyanobacterium]